MLRKFENLVNEAIEDGFARGTNVFMENLEEDLVKDEIITEAGSFDNVLNELFEGSDDNIDDDNIDDIDMEKVDDLLSELGDE